MEALAVGMTVCQYISTARRGVVQRFPRRIHVNKYSLQGLDVLQAAGVCDKDEVNRSCYIITFILVSIHTRQRAFLHYLHDVSKIFL